MPPANSADEPVKLLLVDDKPENLETLRAALADPRYELISADSGRSALEQLLKHQFAVVILDVKMPGMSGFETATMIRGRERSQHTPIIFLTAHSGDEATTIEGYKMGAVDYLTKPARADVLRAKVAVFADLFRVQRQLQQQLDETQRLNTELAAANRELETFSYSVAHDLRAPLRHIAGHASLLLQSSELSTKSEERRALERISAAAVKLGQLIDGLLEFSRVSRTQLRAGSVPLDRLVVDVQHDLEPESHDRPVVWKIAPLPEVQGDRVMLRQVFANLLGNALKYSRGRNPAIIEVDCQQTSRETVVAVHDNGAGFDMRYADKLFGVFQRLHREEEFEGTGIGLASVQRIIQRHGGRTWAEGKVDHGATFYFSLPIGPSPSLQQSHTA
jgi:two-component system sensor histidine kinase/response regulator